MPCAYTVSNTRRHKAKVTRRRSHQQNKCVFIARRNVRGRGQVVVVLLGPSLFLMLAACSSVIKTSFLGRRTFLDLCLIHDRRPLCE